MPKATNGLAPCKNCNGMVGVYIVPHSLEDHFSYKVICVNCHIDATKEHETREAAIEEWNSSHDPMHTTPE